MASTLHDIVLEALRTEPAIVLEAVARAFPDVPTVHGPVVVADPVLRQVLNTEHRADLVLLFGGEKPSLAVVVEVQRDRDGHKPWRWPLYVSTLAERYRCPVYLVVVALTPRTASWAKALPRTSPSLSLHPVVLDEETVPGLDELAPEELTAARLLVAVGMHLSSQATAKFLRGVPMDHLTGVDDFGGSREYTQLVLALFGQTLPPLMMEGDMNPALKREVQAFWDKTVGVYESRGEARGEARGRLNALRGTVLRLVAVRGWSLTDEQRSMLDATDDPEQLQRWCDRMVTCSSFAEVLAG
jgi:hypothetical protein